MPSKLVDLGRLREAEERYRQLYMKHDRLSSRHSVLVQAYMVMNAALEVICSSSAPEDFKTEVARQALAKVDKLSK